MAAYNKIFKKFTKGNIRLCSKFHYYSLIKININKNWKIVLSKNITSSKYSQGWASKLKLFKSKQYNIKVWKKNSLNTILFVLKIKVILKLTNRLSLVIFSFSMLKSFKLN